MDLLPTFDISEITLILSYRIYRIIMQPIEFASIKEKRYEKITNRLEQLREAQLIFKSEYNQYANNFDDLVSFLQNGAKSCSKMPQLVQLFHIVLISDDSNNFDFNIRPHQMTRKYCLMAQNYHQMTRKYHQLTQKYHQMTQNHHQMTQIVLQGKK